MKKYLAMMLCIVLSLTMISPVYAAGTEEASPTVQSGEETKVVESIEIIQKPKLTYYQYVDTQYSFDGLKILVTYSDDSTEELAYGEVSSQGYEMKVTSNLKLNPEEEMSTPERSYSFTVALNEVKQVYTVTYKKFEKVVPKNLEYGKDYQLQDDSYTAGNVYKFTTTDSAGLLAKLSGNAQYTIYDMDMKLVYNQIYSGNKSELKTISLAKNNSYYLIVSPLTDAETRSCSFNIRPTAEADFISVVTKPEKTEYVSGIDSSISFSGTELKVHYKNGFEEIVKIDSPTFYGKWFILDVTALEYDVDYNVIPGTYPIGVVLGDIRTEVDVTFLPPSSQAQGSLSENQENTVSLQKKEGKTFEFVPESDGAYCVDLKNAEDISVLFTDKLGKNVSQTGGNFAWLKGKETYYITLKNMSAEQNFSASVVKVQEEVFPENGSVDVTLGNKESRYYLYSVSENVIKTISVSASEDAVVTVLDEDGNRVVVLGKNQETGMFGSCHYLFCPDMKYHIVVQSNHSAEMEIQVSLSDYEVEGHTHNFQTEIQEATCAQEGKKTIFCDCGIESVVTIPIDPDNHQFGTWTQTKAPTVTSEGEETRTCGLCGEKETRTVAKIPAKASFDRQTYQLYATAKVKAKLVSNMTGDAFVSVRSSSTAIATIAKDGTITGVKSGTATITATTKSGKTISATVKVVTPSVKLNLSSIPLQLKKSTTAVKVKTKLSTDSVSKWSSSNSKIITVNAKTGKITAKKAGKAYIIVKMKSGATAKCKVTVQKSPVKTTKLTVNQTKVTLKLKGGKKTFQIAAVKTPVTSLEKVTYKSSNTKVATVSSKGKITAKKAGKATITVKAGNKVKKITVTVKKK